jgi:hypothetical protein
MAKSRWGSVALALAFSGLPLIAQAEDQAGVQPGVAVMDTTTDAGQAIAPPSPMGRVARASFTTEVVAREPQDSIESLGNENTRIIFFTELHGAQGQTVFHVWDREGTEMARVAFDVGSSRWRVYSTKNLEPSWLGQWTVRVEDADGRQLHSAGFSYVSTANAIAPEKTNAAAQVLSPDSEQHVTPTQQPPANAP